MNPAYVPIKILAALAAIFLTTSCAPSVISPPGPPLNHQEINRVAAVIDAQNQAVQTLFSSGSISLKGRRGELDAEVLMVAARDPYRIKIEITHPWGRPLAHVLINDAGLRFLSFPEKRLYVGQLGDPDLSRHLTVPLDDAVLWSVVRAYPVPPPYTAAISRKAHQITLLTQSGKEQAVIHMGPQDQYPASLFFPRQETEVTFSDFDHQGKIMYARKIRVNGERGNKLSLRLKTMVFNEPLAPEIFKLNIPADVTIQPLSEGGGQP